MQQPLTVWAVGGADAKRLREERLARAGAAQARALAISLPWRQMMRAWSLQRRGSAVVACLLLRNHQKRQVKLWTMSMRIQNQDTSRRAASRRASARVRTASVCFGAPQLVGAGAAHCAWDSVRQGLCLAFSSRCLYLMQFTRRIWSDCSAAQIKRSTCESFSSAHFRFLSVILFFFISSL